MSKNPIETIVILGGGTAGWLTALYFNRALGNSVKITLVESPKKPAIGVGEATVPTIRFTMKYLGFREEEWMPLSQASYKAAVKFIDWKQLGHHYYHPFHKNKEFENTRKGLPKFPDLPKGWDALQVYANLPLKDRTTDFARWASATPEVCDNQQAPIDPKGQKAKVSYAYHFDVSLLNQFFRKKAIERGVHFLEGHFTGAQQSDQGFIKHLNLEDGQKVAADLFIDCTGFQCLLVKGVLKEPFQSGHPHLLCDSALALQLPYQKRSEELAPYTTAQALSAGWCWRTPLQNRLGTGYVYSSEFLSEDQAWTELQNQYSGRTQDLEPRKISMKVGRLSRPWVKNAIAIGLSCSFIEPLESTAIAMIEYQLHSLASLFPDKSFPNHLSHRYNEKINHCYDELKDFIIAHYFFSKREDSPFWQTARKPERLTESLKRFLNELPAWVAAPQRQKDWSFFQRFNWACILSGMGALPHVSLPMLATVRGTNDTSQKFEPLGTKLKGLPPHSEFLDQFRKGPSL